MSKTCNKKILRKNTCLDAKTLAQYYNRIAEVGNSLLVWTNSPKYTEVDNSILGLKNVSEDITV